MSDFSVRSDNVDVEQIMRQIRARIREKRGVDYTEEEIRELANVKLEKFIDPEGRALEPARGVPPGQHARAAGAELRVRRRHALRNASRADPLAARAVPSVPEAALQPEPADPGAAHPGGAEPEGNAERNARREQLDALHYEVIHNLVVELTRTGVEVKSLKMRLESMASRLDFDERRARALEGVVQYRAGAVPPLQPPTGQEQGRRDQGQRRDQGPAASDPQQGRARAGAAGSSWTGQSRVEPAGPRPPASPVPAPRVAVPARRRPVEANALDADGNERRARRRRRRGRRRPGEREDRGREMRRGAAGRDASSVGEAGAEAAPEPSATARRSRSDPASERPRIAPRDLEPRASDATAPAAARPTVGRRRTASSNEAGGRRPALRRGHQRRRGAARALHRRTSVAPRLASRS